MSEPDFTNPEELKKQFYHLARGADFDRIGPWLMLILKHKGEIDIPEKDLRDAFTMAIQYRLNDGKTEEALRYMARIGQLGEITPDLRRKMIETLMEYLKDKKDELVKADWKDIRRWLQRQIKYVQLKSADEKLVNDLVSNQQEVNEHMTFAPEAEEGPMREFITEFTGLFYQSLPKEEAADYASQIIIESTI